MLNILRLIEVQSLAVIFFGRHSLARHGAVVLTGFEGSFGSKYEIRSWLD